jgi:hypothetical protein
MTRVFELAVMPMSVKHLGHDYGSADGRCRKVARALAM